MISASAAAIVARHFISTYVGVTSVVKGTVAAGGIAAGMLRLDVV